MPNPRLFRTTTVQSPATTKNNAGGRAYATSDMHALASLACTGVFNNTYYTKAEDQLAKTLELCAKVPPVAVMRIAMYSRAQGFMKDMPVLLLTYLFSLENKTYFNAAFPVVVDRIGQLRNFVQMVRSGVTGRKSLGTAGKKAIAKMLNNMDTGTIFWQATGSGMSFADVLKLAHVRPVDGDHDAFFAYMLGKPNTEARLPEAIQDFERFKRGETTEVPKVPFLRLTSLNLSTEQWAQAGKNMSWNQLRLNLNNLARKGALLDTAALAEKLRNPEAVQRAKVLPFSLYNTVKHLDAMVPMALANAMNDALEISSLNAPALPGKTLVLVDSSGSMNSSATGHRAGATSTMRCVDAAGYFAISLLKANPDSTTVVPFDTSVRTVRLNPRDSVATLVKSLPTMGGGTNIACGLDWALLQPTVFDQIIILSDNEAWVDSNSYWAGRATASKMAFERYRQKRNRACKIVCVNIQPGTTTVQVPDDRNTLNVSGLNDAVFRVLEHFLANSNDHWGDTLSKILPNMS